MTNYGEMQHHIADALGRFDLKEQIARAIRMAIQQYQYHPMDFNQSIHAVHLSKGCHHLRRGEGLPENYLYAKNVSIIHQKCHLELQKQAWDELALEEYGTQHLARPMAYAMLGGNLKLSPIPDQTYTLAMTYVNDFPALNKDEDSNPWLVEAGDLIFYTAKAHILFNVVRDFEEAEHMKRLEQQSLTGLQARQHGQSDGFRIEARG